MTPLPGTGWIEGVRLWAAAGINVQTRALRPTTGYRGGGGEKTPERGGRPFTPFRWGLNPLPARGC